MFAVEVSDTVWLAIIGVIAMVIKELFDRLRARDVARKVEEAKKVVEETDRSISQKLDANTILTVATNETAKSQDNKLAVIASKVEEVHQATNGIVDRLVDATVVATKAEAKVDALNDKITDANNQPKSNKIVGDKL